MFVFPNARCFDIEGLKIGGQPGENPPVLVGTMFYEGHKIVAPDGFDKSRAEALLQAQLEMSEQTKIPSMMNVFADSSEKLAQRVEFVADRSKIPILIDSPQWDVRSNALSRFDEIGLSKRIVYNSLNMTINKDEINAIKNSKINSGLILAYNPTDSSLEGKMNFLEKDGAFGKGLLSIAEECGLENVLVDTAVTPIHHGAGTSMKSLVALKSKFGWPVGCAIHNAVVSWNWLSGRESKKIVDVASNIIPIILGADFVMFGPVENAKSAFDVAAFAESIVEEAMEGLVEVKGLGL